MFIVTIAICTLITTLATRHTRLGRAIIKTRSCPVSSIVLVVLFDTKGHRFRVGTARAPRVSLKVEVIGRNSTVWLLDDIDIYFAIDSNLARIAHLHPSSIDELRPPARRVARAIIAHCHRISTDLEPRVMATARRLLAVNILLEGLAESRLPL